MEARYFGLSMPRAVPVEKQEDLTVYVTGQGVTLVHLESGTMIETAVIRGARRGPPSNFRGIKRGWWSAQEVRPRFFF